MIFTGFGEIGYSDGNSNIRCFPRVKLDLWRDHTDAVRRQNVAVRIGQIAWFELHLNRGRAFRCFKGQQNGGGAAGMAGFAAHEGTVQMLLRAPFPVKHTACYIGNRLIVELRRYRADRTRCTNIWFSFEIRHA